MATDKTAYHDLERRFRQQVERDQVFAIDRVKQGRGIYLPCVEPANQVDYILVGMEPSFSWADSVEHAEKKIAEGFHNFGCPSNPKSPLALFMRSIKRYLCQTGETYHLTDVSKGAMPVTVAALDRDRRYTEWYPLLLEEIALVGKPRTPIIAIGKKVERFLKGCDLKRTTAHPLCAVQHYSSQASGYYKEEAERDRDGFERFKKGEFRVDGDWPADLSLAKKQLVFAYKKQFEAIRAAGQQVSE
jgi:hypothetical protein